MYSLWRWMQQALKDRCQNLFKVSHSITVLQLKRTFYIIRCSFLRVSKKDKAHLNISFYQIIFFKGNYACTLCSFEILVKCKSISLTFIMLRILTNAPSLWNWRLESELIPDWQEAARRRSWCHFILLNSYYYSDKKQRLFARGKEDRKNEVTELTPTLSQFLKCY